jgi:ketosteroid isomerase-like protein
MSRQDATDAQLSTLEERVDRLESIEAIRDLVARYAVTLDERDFDGLMELFAEDVKASRDAPPGREPLRRHYERLADSWGYTVHQVFHQVIDFESPDRAMGRVYCRAEHETPSAHTVAVAMLRYLDRYERRDGRWYFRWRRTAQWYVKQDPDAPMDQPRIHWPAQDPADAALPDMVETYHRYYETRGGRT